MTQIETFVRQFTGVVVATLAPVVLLAFLCIPMALGGHPGERASLGAETLAQAASVASGVTGGQG